MGTVPEVDAVRVRREAGSWVRTYTWDHVAHLTFAMQPTEASAGRQVRRWKRRLEQRAGRAVDVLHAVERGGSGMRHIHALTAGTGALPPRALRAAWPCGRSVVSVYEARRGAASYVCKSFGGADAVYDIDVRAACPRVRLARDFDKPKRAEAAE